MATYAELRAIFSDATYRNKIETAIVDQATVVLQEADGTANHASRLSLAFKVIEDTQTFAERFAKAILLKNKAFTTGQITGATDASALAEVASLWDEFAAKYGV